MVLSVFNWPDTKIVIRSLVGLIRIPVVLSYTKSVPPLEFSGSYALYIILTPLLPDVTGIGELK